MERRDKPRKLVLAVAVVLATTAACDQRPERQADMAIRAAGETYTAGYEMLGDAIEELERDIARSGCRERRAHDGQSPYRRDAPGWLSETYRFAWNNCDAALSGLQAVQAMAEEGGSGQDRPRDGPRRRTGGGGRGDGTRRRHPRAQAPVLVHQAEGFAETAMSISVSCNPTPSTPLGFTARVSPA